MAIDSGGSYFCQRLRDFSDKRKCGSTLKGIHFNGVNVWTCPKCDGEPAANQTIHEYIFQEGDK